ncbi:hypothetical protein CANARDRAFT_16575 [[Candida] arabinofermentans NRRL YB-2248]|uniref:Ureidoglycolate lyase n=1 Tax=[Candida] arabinofermentans NRRL YB-2248 TaxID=983967 RepID=A0A1E4T329_9ASCO|nr:hypothetical protein CANARDRAFT_16575 [[Candida] arabinofermentans NRRL YB-2248]
MTIIKEYTLSEEQLKQIKAVPLTPESFAKFGSIISADHQVANAPKSSANQGTAIKLHKVAPITNNYKDCKSGVMGTANWNIFRCSPPKHLLSESGTSTIYTSKVLERHPFSTQTFMPMGRAKSNIPAYLVICAPTDYNTDGNLPDYTKLEAFLCQGNQSVTYGMGTWHAPMVALGDEEYLDFGVLVHENGVPEEDCEECVYSPGFQIVF